MVVSAKKNVPFMAWAGRKSEPTMAVVELLSCLKPVDLSLLKAASFGRSGLFLALLGEPDRRYPDLAPLLVQLASDQLLVSQVSLRETNLLSALAACCLGEQPIGATVVLPLSLCGEDRTGRRVLCEPGQHHLLAIPAERQADARLLASAQHVPLWPLGRTTGQQLAIRLSEGPGAEPFPMVLRLSLPELREKLSPQ